MNDTYKITNVQPQKMMFIKSILTITYYHIILIILIKKITELREGEFE